MTLPHWYGFDSSVGLIGHRLQSPTNWDRVRQADVEGSFGFGASRQEWIDRANAQPQLRQRAHALSSLIRRWDVRRLVSVGVGTGMLEYLLAKASPELQIRCGDYAADSVAILRDRFIECETVEVMDLKRPNWVADPDEVILLNRVDTELSDAEWRTVFRDIWDHGAQRVIWIPCGLLTPAIAFREVTAVVLALLRRRRLAQAGFLRTEARILDLFNPAYIRSAVYDGGDLPLWELRRLPRLPQGADHQGN